MITQKTNLGTIEISPEAVASLAEHAVLQSYGVVGLANRGRFEAWRRGWRRSGQERKGVFVDVRDEGVVIDLHLIVAYGTRISEVARGVIHRVTYTVEQALGLPVLAVNVHVQALRVSPFAGDKE
ncbi:MAG TPA: Asp23/Gls24 family envelope stress response protein [Anaerolineae bacterium]|nr:Asp23/Gls24 family envelope stress response protein [Caldilineae bacterium]HID33078.1 Asp23/Gls24 family envelope stress response protein [Anaerolineae bacterium]